ncbi:hypothetical protein F0L68_33505 [Solihabitans fulvus]|uniref:Uncharacterized protein n=1 Tax=Solihabitans fulvus TaxID=1892852 RepID=A0A5B2WTX7_9PSEU|nr:hypothetical protein [Solihabitans fulvus]KAA2253327.1 hypothetical protein F0L68_33505 [Solihabitans fulvus]
MNWHIPCRDATGRARHLHVKVTDDHQIAVIAPPGEAAYISPAHYGELRDALQTGWLRIRGTAP